MKKILVMLVLLTTMLTANAQPRVYDQEHTGNKYALRKFPTFDQLPEIRELPNPLEGVKNFKGWKKQRARISSMIQHYGIGEKPAVKPSQVKARLQGDTLLVVDVTVGGETLTLQSVIRYPKTGQPPYALMIGTSMNSLPRQLFEGRPIAMMTFREKQVNDYGQWGPHHERGEHNFDRLYPDLKDNGAYSEWAWGLSRLIDGLQQLGPEVTKIDTRHIGVTGSLLRCPGRTRGADHSPGAWWRRCCRLARVAHPGGRGGPGSYGLSLVQGEPARHLPW